jgi:hypothetical protein
MRVGLNLGTFKKVSQPSLALAWTPSYTPSSLSPIISSFFFVFFEFGEKNEEKKENIEIWKKGI